MMDRIWLRALVSDSGSLGRGAYMSAQWAVPCRVAAAIHRITATHSGRCHRIPWQRIIIVPLGHASRRSGEDKQAKHAAATTSRTPTYVNENLGDAVGLRDGRKHAQRVPRVQTDDTQYTGSAVEK